MLRQRFEAWLEELKQTVAPTPPEIGTPQPRTIFERAPVRASEAAIFPDETAPRPRPEPPRSERPRPAPVPRRNALRTHLASPAQRRAAFQLMEILGPPVSLRDPLDRVQDR